MRSIAIKNEFSVKLWRMKSIFVPSIMRVFRLRKWLGPGLITGAADDDPSGIATYSQAGAQYGGHG